MTEPTIIDSDAPKPKAHDPHIGQPEAVATVTREQLIALLMQAWDRGHATPRCRFTSPEHDRIVDVVDLAETWMAAWRKQGNPPAPATRLSADGDRLL